MLENEFEPTDLPQSDETLEAPVNPAEDTTPAEPTAAETLQSLRVKYNKEEREIPIDEAIPLVQKGLNYDKVQERLQQLESDPRLTFVEELAQQFGMSVPDYLEAVKAQREQERINQLVEQGVSEEVAAEMLENRKFREQFEAEKKAKAEEEKFIKESEEFFQEFPDVKPDQIPAEVWQIKEQRGLSLLDAYLRVSYKSLGQQKEQEAIQKLQQNAQSTPGALGAGAEHKAGYSNMSAADKKALRERVLRGENIEY